MRAAARTSRTWLKDKMGANFAMISAPLAEGQEIKSGVAEAEDGAMGRGVEDEIEVRSRRFSL